MPGGIAAVVARGPFSLKRPPPGGRFLLLRHPKPGQPGTIGAGGRPPGAHGSGPRSRYAIDGWARVPGVLAHGFHTKPRQKDPVLPRNRSYYPASSRYPANDGWVMPPDPRTPGVFSPGKEETGGAGWCCEGQSLPAQIRDRFCPFFRDAWAKERRIRIICLNAGEPGRVQPAEVTRARPSTRARAAPLSRLSAASATPSGRLSTLSATISAQAAFSSTASR